MASYQSFDTVPSRDDAPDVCQWTGCDVYPAAWVHYYDTPDEYVCYCRDHAQTCRQQFPAAKSDGLLS